MTTTSLEQNIKLPEFAIGTWAWGDKGSSTNNYFGSNYNQNDFKQIFDAAMKDGFNLFDTAAVYGNGVSEKSLGELIKDVKREDIIISTKFSPWAAPEIDNSMETMLNDSLKRLNTDYVDIYWIHGPQDVKKWTPQLVPLVKSGKVKSVGVSNHNLSQIKEAKSLLEQNGIKLSAIQNHVSLLDRLSESQGILEYCNENDITVFSYMVLEQGLLTGRFNNDHPFPENSNRGKMFNPHLEQIKPLIEALDLIAKKYDASAAQVAISWAKSKNTLPILGVTKDSQLKSNEDAFRFDLSKEDINYLESAAEKTNYQTSMRWEKDI